MNKIQFWKQYWWFWALAAGVPVAGFLGYQYLKDEGYLGGGAEYSVDESGDVWDEGWSER